MSNWSSSYNLQGVLTVIRGPIIEEVHQTINPWIYQVHFLTVCFFLLFQTNCTAYNCFYIWRSRELLSRRNLKLGPLLGTQRSSKFSVKQQLLAYFISWFYIINLNHSLDPLFQFKGTSILHLWKFLRITFFHLLVLCSLMLLFLSM